MEFERMDYLFDFYGELLTPYQKELMNLHLNEDLTYTEIAAIHGKSRQAVYDTVIRSMDKLEEYESKLQLYKRFTEDKKELKKIYEALENELQERPKTLDDILRKLEDLIY